MTVRELICKLENIKNKDLEITILARVWDSHFEEELEEYNSIQDVLVETYEDFGETATIIGDR